jgi:2'-hydroxyisoflavone reductase
MKLLLLGGTHFLGRHLAEIALARGHRVTVFTRGKRPLPTALVGHVEALTGDRDPRNAPGLAALEAREWDAAIDTSGYVPRVVGASAALLSERVARYVFVSSISVYAKADAPGIDEDAPLAALPDAATEDIAAHYGALKAACESEVSKTLGARATIVRPGLIVGPYDATDRFGYWPARFVHPQLLGDRGPHAVVPAPRERPIQFIDARDLAAWILDLVERDVGGTFNAVSPRGRWTFGALIDACIRAASAPPEPLEVADAKLLAFHVEPWTGLPLWLPANEPDHAGLMEASSDRAQAAGLVTRPLVETAVATAAWLAERDNANAWKSVLSDARERQIVSASRTGGGLAHT